MSGRTERYKLETESRGGGQIYDNLDEEGGRGRRRIGPRHEGRKRNVVTDLRGQKLKAEMERRRRNEDGGGGV